MNTNAELENLMLRYGLRRRELARLLDKPLNSAGGYSNSTVDRWLAGIHRVPNSVVELLQFKLENRNDAGDPWLRLLRQPVPYSGQRELEWDLARVFAAMRAGHVPKTGRVRKSLPLRRAGYLLELAAYLGGPKLAPMRELLLAKAARLRRRVNPAVKFEPFCAGHPVRNSTLDDLAERWRLAPGVDIRRFRQLAQSGHA